MKKNNHLKTFHRLKGLIRLGVLYQCYNCREEFLVKFDEDAKCPTCGTTTRERDLG